MVVAIVKKITEKRTLIEMWMYLIRMSMTTAEPIELRANMRNLLTHIGIFKDSQRYFSKENIATIFRLANSIDLAWLWKS